MNTSDNYLKNSWFLIIEEICHHWHRLSFQLTIGINAIIKFTYIIPFFDIYTLQYIYVGPFLHLCESFEISITFFIQNFTPLSTSEQTNTILH